MIDIVSATRLSSRDFWARSALGQSLKRMAHDTRIKARISFCNRKGLAEVYNARIAAPDAQETLVFMHDDVWIDEPHFVERVQEGLSRYDVIGVVGNRRRQPFQPGWAYADPLFNWDADAHLSGAIAHGLKAGSELQVFGDWPSDCELLDGVFMAARKSSLRDKDVSFDTRFKFHMYDVDFSRRARQQGLSVGTWPIHLTHQSDGAFGTPSWNEQFRLYLEKWGD